MSDLMEEQNNLRLYGEKIVLDADNCIVKENNYYDDVTPKGLTGFDTDKPIEQYVEQSVIIYYHEANGESEKFISHIFLSDAITLKTHLLNNEVVLYIDKADRNKYFFDYTTT